MAPAAPARLGSLPGLYALDLAGSLVHLLKAGLVFVFLSNILLSNVLSFGIILHLQDPPMLLVMPEVLETPVMPSGAGASLPWVGFTALIPYSPSYTPSCAEEHLLLPLLLLLLLPIVSLFLVCICCSVTSMKASKAGAGVSLVHPPSPSHMHLSLRAMQGNVVPVYPREGLNDGAVHSRDVGYETLSLLLSFPPSPGLSKGMGCTARANAVIAPCLRCAFSLKSTGQIMSCSLGLCAGNEISSYLST